jgi:ADP-heptose:LPS heptosyltransferase
VRLRVRLLLDFYVGGTLHAILKIPTILLGKLMGRNHDLTSCRDIAVLKLLGGGSLVIAYPALLALKKLPRVRRLILVTTPAIKPFGDTLGIFDEIVVIREDSFPHLGMDSLAAIRRLFRYDAVVDLEIHSRLTTVFSLLTCARNRVGFFTSISFWRRGISTHLLFCNVTNGIYYFYDQVAEIFGAVPVSEQECTEAFRKQIHARAAGDNQIHLAIAPTCSGLSSERMLAPAEWVDILGKRLLKFPDKIVQVHLFGAPSDVLVLDGLKDLFLEHLGKRIDVVNHAGKTKLDESVRLLSAMTEVLCIDSALLHFSRLLGMHTISYWGPTDPRVLARPRANRSLDEIHHVKLPCSPCIHISQQPPCKGRNICMRLAADPSAAVPLNPPWVLQ